MHREYLSSHGNINVRSNNERRVNAVSKANRDIYSDIAKRTGGDIYVGVVGPVRTGKSTFIKKFMESLVLPNIENEYDRERTKDELPQSAQGKTVMTTEPKFIPAEAVTVKLNDNSSFRVKMIDCVGFIVPEALGNTENGQVRMVHTPWQTEPLPFEQAAEMGTKKVITDHCTIGMLITCDGTFGEIGRENYVKAEEQTVSELKKYDRPFVMILNSAKPESAEAIELAMQLEEKYGSPVALLNCLELNGEDIKKLLELVLHEFPIAQVGVNIPRYLLSLPTDHPVCESVTSSVISLASQAEKIRDIVPVFSRLTENENIESVSIDEIDLGTGKATVTAVLPEGLFYTILSEQTGFEIDGEETLLPVLRSLAESKKKYDKVSMAYDEVMRTGYGIVSPDIEDLSLKEPEIVKQPGGYGVKLRASAPSVHMIKAEIQTEVSPMVGTEEQSEELVKYLLREFDSDKDKIWETNIFGKSLHELVNDGLNAKLAHMPADSRARLGETLERIINEGSGGLICIIL